MKKVIIIGLSAAALYLLYTAYKKNEALSVKEKPEATPEPDVPKEPPFVCPEGEILCENKEKTCYNPAAKYIVNPCS